ncbi:unnamed protein product [Adineta steineri]|uniref:Sel1 repeat family protein n=2 Tax=Adineta steineri TaxID=433720 RepID=A0A814TYP8_9BILA|nr:unnamed protein product [Adineta steineri]CAF1071048.1 unnamed protein product [Adineta steineri]CAF1117945.1 unnamed protein product [Adineta steineri]CAF1168051.1 unnamed protein product [Adineta steineri]CAF1204686.1 unnamed protein product [Adineta steineri]
MMATAEEEIRRRLLDVAPEPNESLPFHGRVRLARRKKPDPWYIKAAEGLLLCLALGLLYATYYHFEHVHFHVNRFYANLGYKEAQHNLGHGYMHGVGADHHPENAVYWLKQASDQGHAKAQYNLAISHLRGFKTGLQPGEARKLIEKAAEAGVPEAIKTLETICAQGGCET